MEYHERLANRLLSDTIHPQIGDEGLDQLGSQLAQLERAKARQHVLVQDCRVEPLRVALEVLARVPKPPFFGEVGERLFAGVEVVEVALAFHEGDFGLEGLGIFLAVEDLGTATA